MRGERWGNRNNCVFSPFSVPSPSSYHPLYMAGLLNDLYSLGKTPALWGGGRGMGVYSMSHPDYPISCYVDRHARCILLIVKFFKLCILFRFAGSLCTEIKWFEFWVNFWKFISQRVVNVTGGGGEGVSRTSLQDFPINKPLSCQELAMICDLFLLQQGSSQRWSPGTKSWIWSIICPPKNGKLQKEGI